MRSGTYHEPAYVLHGSRLPSTGFPFPSPHSRIAKRPSAISAMQGIVQAPIAMPPEIPVEKQSATPAEKSAAVTSAAHDHSRPTPTFLFTSLPLSTVFPGDFLLDDRRPRLPCTRSRGGESGFGRLRRGFAFPASAATGVFRFLDARRPRLPRTCSCGGESGFGRLRRGFAFLARAAAGVLGFQVLQKGGCRSGLVAVLDEGLEGRRTGVLGGGFEIRCLEALVLLAGFLHAILLLAVGFRVVGFIALNFTGVDSVIDVFAEAVLVFERVGEHDGLVELAHVAGVVGVGGEDILAFLGGVFVFCGEGADGGGGDEVGVLGLVEVGPVEIGGGGDGGVAGGVVARAEVGGREEGVGVGEGLEGDVCGGAGGFGDFVCGGRG